MSHKKICNVAFVFFFFTYPKMQLLTGIADSFLVWETYIIQSFQIVLHSEELKQVFNKI